ncbi:MAG: arylsulfotransferase family protein [Paracoccaceae bacterium]
MSSIARFVFTAGLCFLAFVWGVAASTWKVFPHRQIEHVLAGVDAWGKFDDRNLPLNVIGPAANAKSVDPIKTFASSGSDDLILVTGGFFFRQDVCPSFGCMAYVMDRTGKVIHSWEYDPDLLFSDEDFSHFKGKRSRLNLNVQGIDIGGDGSLVVVFQGKNLFPYQVGIAKFSWEGKLQWVRIDNSHHWPKVGTDGRIYSPIARIVTGDKSVGRTKEPSKCKSGAVFQEGVQVLSPNGEELHRFWMDDVVQVSDMQGLEYSVRNDCDPFHVNGIALLNAAAAARMPGTDAGDLLVSLRSSSALVVMDQQDGHIKKLISGPMVAQHSPSVLPNGELAVFDNLGGLDTKNGSRVLIIDPSSGENHTAFPRLNEQPGADLFADQQGAIRFSADGTRMLIAETVGGRLFEAEVATGRPLWELDTVSDMRPYYEMTGQDAGETTLMRVHTQGAQYLSLADVASWSAAP